MKPRDINPYDVLHIQPGASLLEIARARRRLAKRYHPDVARGSHATERMQMVNAAWEMLSDPQARRGWEGAALSWVVRATHPTANPGQRWTEWTYGDPPSGPVRSRTTQRPRPTGWWVLIGTSLLLILILAGGLIAAIDGPSTQTRDSPVLQDNLDSP